MEGSWDETRDWVPPLSSRRVCRGARPSPPGPESRRLAPDDLARQDFPLCQLVVGQTSSRPPRPLRTSLSG